MPNTTTYQYLKAVSDMVKKMRQNTISELYYYSIEQLIFENGMVYEYQPIPNIYGFGKMRECFMNAFQLAIANPELTYVEGYATSIIPTLHAWCISKDGIVVDNTWRDDENAYKRGYFGIAFPTDYIMKIAYQRGKYGIIDNPEMNFPLLREKFYPENLK